VSERDMSKLLALIEAHLGAGWVEISDWLRDQATVDEIEARLLRGDIAGVLEEVEQAALKFAAETHQQYVRAGRETATWLDDQVDDRLIRFDETNPRSVARAERNRLEYVYGLRDEQREKINRVLIDGARTGANPREMARDIRDGLGLTPQQDAAVRSYRSALEAGDFTNALNRELRDARSDRSLLAARRDATALPAEQIDRMVERYRANYIDYRATVIARTEGLRALHEGNEDMFRQAIERGDVEADALVREWNHAGHGPDSRPGHVKLNGTQQKFGEPFVNPITGASLRYPGDPAAGPKETAQCRCALGTRLLANSTP
jgi:hypothetical protein